MRPAFEVCGRQADNVRQEARWLRVVWPEEALPQGEGGRAIVGNLAHFVELPDARRAAVLCHAE
eukprot:10888327-Lingulodinium_polyedra.AAC.1